MDFLFQRSYNHKKEEAHGGSETEAGFQSKYITEDESSVQYTSAPSLSVAPLRSPPIEDGLMYCFNELYATIHFNPKYEGDVPSIELLQKVIDRELSVVA